VGTKVKDTAKYGTHESTDRNTKDFTDTVKSQKILLQEKAKLDPIKKLKAEVNVIGMAMLLIIIYQTIAISIISRELEIEPVESKDNKDKNTEQTKEPKQEQPKEQQQNSIEPTELSMYACKVKTELEKYMAEHTIKVPSQMMQKMNMHRGIFTKLKNTCEQKPNDTLGMDKMKEVLVRLDHLKRSN
jgi:hypothetical protein